MASPDGGSSNVTSQHLCDLGRRKGVSRRKGVAAEKGSDPKNAKQPSGHLVFGV